MAYIPYSDAGIETVPMEVEQNCGGNRKDEEMTSDTSIDETSSSIEDVLITEREITSDTSTDEGIDITEQDMRGESSSDETSSGINGQDMDEGCTNESNTATKVQDTHDEDLVITGQETCSVPKHKKRIMSQEEFTIIKSGQMLTDVSINVAQTLLHMQFPYVEGLEDTVLGPAFQFSIAGGEFVQVLHDGSIPWICVSNIGCPRGVIKCFNSLKKGYLKTFVEKQLASC